MSKKKKKSKKINRTDMDLIESKLASIGSGVYFKPLEGKNQIRILPPWNDEGYPFHEECFHYGLKREGKNVSVPGPHPVIMKAIKKLEKSGKEDSKLAKRLAPRTKFYANILDRKSKKIMVWGFSRKILSTILSYMADPDWGDITDIEEGHDLIIERTGQNLDTKYEIRIKPKPSELGDVNLDELHQLDELVEEIDDDEVEEMLEQVTGESSEGDDDDDDEDDGDEDDDDEEGGEEEDEEEDDDDEEDDDEEDEEEEEEEEKVKPKKKKKKAKKETKKKRKTKKETKKSKKKKRKK